MPKLINALAPYRLVAITWLDAYGVEEQTTMEEVRAKYARPQVFTLFGLLINENDEGYTLANEIEENGQFRHVSFIPRLMVKELVDLGPPRRKVKREKKIKPTL